MQSTSEIENVAKNFPTGMTEAHARSLAGGIRRAVILRTHWYPEILEPLEKSARDYLLGMGVLPAVLETVTLPGSFELPMAAQIACESDPKPDLIVALGCVVRGETPHFDYVCQAATHGLNRVQLDHSVPVGFGLLTVENLGQALARRGKGQEAAHAAFFMYLVRQQMPLSRRRG